ncbi:MAG TPA: VOC family protein, partial [Bryobacteraceae bacterium]
MPERSLTDRLDDALQAMLRSEEPPAGQDLGPLLALAQDLRGLPRDDFKARLRSDLERRFTMATTSQSASQTAAPTRQTATPRLRIKNVAAAIDFYKKAFGATELMRFDVGGQVAHAEIMIGNSMVMLGEEAVEYGYPGPETLGGSPVIMHLWSDDVDRAVEQAVAAGARLAMPVSDQFYGDRTGHVLDPFGYTWGIATRKEELSLEEMHRRLAAQEPPRPPVDPVRKGFRTLTPYLIARDAAGLIEFVKKVFDAEEQFRAIGSAGGIHCEVRLGDSMMMIGGGGPGLSFSGNDQPMAFHVYVRDTDAIYQRALDAGSTSLQAPADQFWGERTANVRDPHGNH